MKIHTILANEVSEISTGKYQEHYLYILNSKSYLGFGGKDTHHSQLDLILYKWHGLDGTAVLSWMLTKYNDTPPWHQEVLSFTVFLCQVKTPGKRKVLATEFTIYVFILLVFLFIFFIDVL